MNPGRKFLNHLLGIDIDKKEPEDDTSAISEEWRTVELEMKSGLLFLLFFLWAPPGGLGRYRSLRSPVDSNSL